MAERRIVKGWIVERGADGRLVPIAPAGGNGGPPPNPTYPLQAPKMQEDIRNTQANTARAYESMKNDSQRVQLDAMKVRGQDAATALEAAKAGLIPDGRGGFMRDPRYRPPAPTLTPATRETALTNLASTMEIGPILKKLEGTYNRGPGATSGIMGLRDFLPLPENQAFNKASDRLRGFIKRTQGLTGGENNTAPEMKMNIGAYIPASSDYDQTTIDNFAAIRGERAKAFKANVAVLGGIPDANGNVTPVPTGYVPGANPELDYAITRNINLVPTAKREAYILDALRRFNAKTKARSSRKPGASGWKIERLDD